MSALVLGRYDSAALTTLFEEEGILGAVRSKGFCHPRVTVEEAGSAPPHVRLYAEKTGRRHLLFDGRLTETVLAAGATALCRNPLAQPISLAVIFWACEQDPTQAFSASRLRLPLQAHPGLGILRRVFRAGLRVARETGKDGLANVPKYPHDALIFFRSLRFLFLDPKEQGRLDALWSDLGHLGLRDLSLAIVGGAVKADDGRTVSWRPGLQVYALSAALRHYFESETYANARLDARLAARHVVDMSAVQAALDTFESWRHGERRELFAEALSA